MITIVSKDLIKQLIEKTDKQRKLHQGDYLFHQGDSICSVFIVEDGVIELTRCLNDGTSIVLQRATSKTILAEASVYSDNYHCGAISTLPSSVWELPKNIFLEELQRDNTLSKLWMMHLACEVQQA